ncbi:hypothetical protein MMC14_000509 [Varicellaria rhodocarpa]|nr:hypothetical protein [Varicellaria rhodocarpa]
MAVKSPSTPSAPTPQPLSFPAATFAKLSPGPYLQAHLQPSSPSSPSIRPNGRLPNEFRPPTVHTGSLTHASGSAVVRVGDTAVVCGVRGEILLARDVPNYRVFGAQGQHPDNRRGEGSSGAEKEKEGRTKKDKEQLAELGLLVPNLELATGCSPAFLPENPPSTLAQSLSQRILTLLHISELISLDDLRIWYTPDPSSSSPSPSIGHADDDDDDKMEGMQEEDEQQQQQQTPEVKAFWTLYIDILFISLDGNPFDAAWAAVLAALKDTLLPRAWWDADRQMVLWSDLRAEAKKLTLRHFPVASTFAVFEGKSGGDGVGLGGKKKKKTTWVLADPDLFEEGLCWEDVTVVVDQEGEGEGEEDGVGMQVLRVEKGGGGTVGIGEMKELVQLAAGSWQEWKTALGS